MLPPTHAQPFKKSVASITNPTPLNPLAENHDYNKHKFIIPTFESRNSIAFWVGLLVFMCGYGMANRIDWLKSPHDIWVSFSDLLTTNGTIILLVVGYLHIVRHRLALAEHRAMLQEVILAVSILTPIASILGIFLHDFFANHVTTLSEMVIYTLTNTVITLIATLLLMYYFGTQYSKIQTYQQSFHQALIEQNEQLKARITPHFFFNMFNTLQSLVEKDSQQASKMIEDVTVLYRASFGEVKEVALLDEIELCQAYLDIERYRFDNKLQVTWDLPDEDLLYDMVIVSLCLQLVIEKMMVYVVEMSTEPLNLHIQIDWVNNIARIDVRINLPRVSHQTIRQIIDEQLNFNNQILSLQYAFGESAKINYSYDGDQLLTKIRYPLTDVG